jgi:hypothetical protein
MLARLAAVVLSVAFAVTPGAAQVDGDACATNSLGALGEAAALADDGDPAAATTRLRGAFEADRRCRPLAVAFWAVSGAAAATEAARRGGPIDLLAPVTGAMAELEMIAAQAGRLSEAEYARAATLAARAAAQDERDEMHVWLTHARQVSARLAAIGDPPRWPQPIDRLEGALWFEVDRFVESADAYERAATREGTVAAWLGLARARARLDRRQGACAAWKAAADLGKQRRPDSVGTVEAFMALADCYR